MKQTRGDRAWAWIGAILAAGVSIAVNIGHAAPISPWFAAFAATLPPMVLIAAEQTARRLLGQVTVPVMVTVGLCAYSLSFWHTMLLLASWGEPFVLQMLGAVAVDGLAVASVIALYVAARRAVLDVALVTPSRVDDAVTRPAQPTTTRTSVASPEVSRSNARKTRHVPDRDRIIAEVAARLRAGETVPTNSIRTKYQLASWSTANRILSDAKSEAAVDDESNVVRFGGAR